MRFTCRVSQLAGLSVLSAVTVFAQASFEWDVRAHLRGELLQLPWRNRDGRAGSAHSHLHPARQP